MTLVESNQILSSFDDRLRKYAEKKISQRNRFNLLQSSVVGKHTLVEQPVHSFFLCSVDLCLVSI